MNAPGWRLASLWLSQVARVLADNWLRLFVFLVLAGQLSNRCDQAWHLVALLWTLPMVVLAPVNGALCNSLPKPRVLAFAALTGLLAILGGLLGVLPWLACWALLALTFAVYGPTRYALFPAAAQDTGLTLPQVNGLFETGSAAATVAGVALAVHFLGGVQPNRAFALVSTTTVSVLCLHAAALLFAAPVRFAGDVYRPERVGQAVRGFFRDCGRIWLSPRARGCLLGLASLRAIIFAFTGAVLQEHLFADQADSDVPVSLDKDTALRVAGLLLWLAGGAALGSLLAGCVRHPVRSQGLVPFGACGFALGLLLVSLSVPIGPAVCVVLGIAASFINVPLLATYQAHLPADARGNGMAARNFCDYAISSLLLGVVLVLSKWAGFGPHGQFWLLTMLTMVLAVIAVRLLFRESIELIFEMMLTPMYRISAEGPGLAAFPRAGPVLVVANHSAWFDPVWLGKVLPRRFRPMMTSRFFDLPILRWLVKHVAGAIRVEESTYRREVPELLEAIAVLDHGQVLLVFPEGGLRRRAERPLKQFGQGIWHILHERPDTPVVVCWIEGGWGSYFSHYNGHPTKNKPFDILRIIRVAFSMPQTIPPEILADQRSTRSYLMDQCLGARGLLGLPVLSLEPEKGEKPEADGEAH